MTTIKSDIEIARAATMKPIAEVAAKVGIPADALVPYGTTKAKVTFKHIDSLKDAKDGRLILVSAMTPTPEGIGKTTTTIGLADALRSWASGPSSASGSLRWGLISASKAAAPARDGRRWCRRRPSTCTSSATCTP